MRRLPSLAIVLILSACAQKPAVPPVSIEPPAPADAELPLSSIHRNLSPLEQVWHIRAGLNVAALSCSAHVGTGIITDYNAFLANKRSLLAEAFAAKQARYPNPRALDTDMTRLYNHFASPPAQPAFCRAAAAEVKRAIADSAAMLAADAAPMLARLDRPFTQPVSAARAAPMVATALPSASLPGGWRIQLGAFSTAEAARAAWELLRSRTDMLAGRSPHYEPVPGKALTRLQLKDVPSRADAVLLCAHAAAAGFDCIPVNGR